MLIKKTHSIEMVGDKDGVRIYRRINPKSSDEDDTMYIPMRVVFQVKRGLESYIQRFYRKHEILSK